jgi:anti-sigma factor RsiW
MGTDLDCGKDAAAYVLGALDDPEATAFRRHLASCEACREEVDLLESAATALPLMVPQYHAPATLRQSVMDEVRRDAREPAKPRAVPRRLGGRTWLARPVPKPILVGLGGLLVIAVITVVLSRGPSGTQYFRGRTAWRGARAAVQLNGSRGVLLVEGMPSPPAGKVYEVWVEHGRNAPSPTDALFDVNARGEAAVDVPGQLSSDDTVLVTAEPDGGTLVPTLPVVVAASLG